MSNIVQIKRGSGKPDGQLAPYELGFDISSQTLYIGGALDGNSYGSAISLKSDSAKIIIDSNDNPANVGSKTEPIFLQEGKFSKCGSDATISGTIENAKSLYPGATIVANLTANNPTTFTGSENISIGVEGTLPVSKGGTGRDTEEKFRLWILDMTYPVGSIYMSIQNNSPETFLGGTWERIENTFLLAAGSQYAAGLTGGSSTVTLTETQTPLKDHMHETVVDPAKFILRPSSHDNRNLVSAVANVSITSTSEKWTYGINTGSTSGQNNTEVAIAPGVTVENASSSTATPHDNMPPYLTVYVWKRTA